MTTWKPCRIGSMSWLEKALKLDAKADRVKDKYDEVPYNLTVPKQVMRMHPGMRNDDPA